MSDIPVFVETVPVFKIVTKHYPGLPPASVERMEGTREIVFVDIPELFRDDPVGLEKYQERRRGIEQRLDKVIRRKA